MDTFTSGSYAVLLFLAEDTVIDVGKLGCYNFPAGYYLYVGSAMRGLRARILRHLRSGQKRHWHVDYLRQHASPREAWIMPSERKRECIWAQAIAGMPEARCPVAGFGSSDCHCASHLFYFARRPAKEDLRRAAPAGEPVLTCWVRD